MIRAGPQRQRPAKTQKKGALAGPVFLPHLAVDYCPPCSPMTVTVTLATASLWSAMTSG